MDLLIKEIMREKEISQVELADKLGITKVAVNLQINGTPTIGSLEKMANALGVQVADFFPVPHGYIHWSERNNQDRFCPECGAEWRTIKRGNKNFKQEQEVQKEAQED